MTTCSFLRTFGSAFLPTVLTLTFAASCAKVSQSPDNGGTGGTGGRTGTGIGTGGAIFTSCVGKCTDFPEAAIVDTGVTGDPSGMFAGAAPTSGGPCITEPEDGTLFPNNWLRPRVKFAKTGGSSQVTQIRMHAANQQNDLVAYTTSDTWLMPASVWVNLRGHQVSDDVTITVWVQGMGASTSTFRTAPVGAAGSLVFWAAKPTEVDKNLDSDCQKSGGQPIQSCYAGDTELRGFKVGDETTIPVLTIPQVVQPSKDNNNQTSHVRCIGCHVGTPDGQFVAFNDAWPWRGVMAGVTATNAGMVPPYLSTGGEQTLWQPALGVITFSKLHWADADRIAITSYSLSAPNQNDWFNAPKAPRPNLAWFDLGSPAVPLVNGNFSGDMNNPTQIFPVTGTNMGIIARTGDPRGGTTPNWGHLNDTIVYTSTDAALDGRLDNQPTPVPNPNNESHNTGHADVWQVPYNNKAGGAATPVKGADTTAFEEYFPSFSADDKLIAFNRVPASQPMYANPSSEIAVIPAAGGTAHVLRANQPPACTGKRSPGVNNHWAKWSPDVRPGLDGNFYWIVFSSNRADIPPVTSNYGAKRSIAISQLYVAPLVVGEFGITSYPAIYLWNQPDGTVNTTPAWESFQLPPVQ